MHSTNIGASALISQLKGSKQIEKAHGVVVETVYATLILSFLFALFFYLSSDQFFRWMGLDVPTQILASKYFKYFIWGAPIQYVFSFQGYIFNAHGDTKVSNLIMIFTLVVNIVLDPFFIFGIKNFPDMGISGASFVTVMSQLLGIFLRGYVLKKKGYIPSWREFCLPQKFIYIRKVFEIGVPVSLSSLVWTLVFPVLTVIITKFGMTPLAGVNIGHRFEGLSYFVGEAFAIASTSLIGQAYGRRDYSGIDSIIKNGLFFLTTILFFVSLLFVFCPFWLASLLNSDPQVIHHAGVYLRIVGYFEILLGWEMYLEGAFNGVGDSKTQMLIRVPLTLIRIPFAYYLAFNLSMGVAGVWWAISISTVAKGIVLLVVWYKKGMALEAQLSN